MCDLLTCQNDVNMQKVSCRHKGDEVDVIVFTGIEILYYYETF